MATIEVFYKAAGVC